MTASSPSPAANPTRVDRNVILGTAGHIDHGKTSLVRALTGTDADRLPEEQRRGMTIELGFAELRIGDIRFGIVDVPGHERFVRTMVAGATGVDLALLVVAADDSVMPQTVEHIEILRLLGVHRAVVALTKIDAVDPDVVALAAEEVRELLAGTPLADAAICPLSSVTGDGVEALKQALLRAAEGVDRAAPTGAFLMAIDRVFTVQGRGTVVTGSVQRGSVSEGDTLEVWPGGLTCRVRGLQTHGTHADVVGGGQRAAINVSGIDRDILQRGSAVATPGYLQPSRMIDAHITNLPSTDRPLKSAATVRLEFGTTEVPVRVVLLDRPTLGPGESAFAQLRCGEALTTVHGQRFILRDENAVRTIGGGVVLRPVARRRRRQPAEECAALQRLMSDNSCDRMDQVLHDHGFSQSSKLRLAAQSGVSLDDVPALLQKLQRGGRLSPIVGTDVCITPAVVDDLCKRCVTWMQRYHDTHPESPGRPSDAVIGWLERMTRRGIAKALFEELLRRKALGTLGRYVCLPSFAPSLSATDERLLATVIGEIRNGAFQPPLLDAVHCAPPSDRKRLARLAALAVAMGELVEIAPKLYLHADVERELRGCVAALIRSSGPITVAQAREALDSSRKYVVPFLEYLDRAGVTERNGDRRVLAQK